jgi:signal transduction histidine kinase
VGNTAAAPALGPGLSRPRLISIRHSAAAPLGRPQLRRHASSSPRYSADGHPPIHRIVFECAETEINGLPAVGVAVSENGPTFTAEQKQRVFEPLFTTKIQDTGLGMAIAQRIVEGQGGIIAADGRSGGDTETRITLL